MTVVVRIKTGITVPRVVQRQAGFKTGDVVEFKAAGGVITIVPKVPTAHDEYTPEQRRIVDARLDKAAAEIKRGHVSLAFDNIEEFAAALKADARKLKKKSGGRPVSTRPGGFISPSKTTPT